MDGISPVTQEAEAGRNLWVLGHPCLQAKAIWWGSSLKKEKKYIKQKLGFVYLLVLYKPFDFLEMKIMFLKIRYHLYPPFKSSLPFPSVRKLHEKEWK